MTENNASIQYLEIDETWRAPIAREWGETVERHLIFSNGFTLIALSQGQSVGLIAVYWQPLPAPLQHTTEGYINIIAVHADWRRRGIASRLVALALQRARQQGAYQLRAWSSEDKAEAIPMWQRLGFGLAPATTYPRGQEVHGFFVTKILGDL